MVEVINNKPIHYTGTYSSKNILFATIRYNKFRFVKYLCITIINFC